MKLARLLVYSIITPALILGLFLNPAPVHAVVGSIITVTGTADNATVAGLNGNGTCDLREAIEAVNTAATVNECTAGSAPYTIQFDMALTGVQTISLFSVLDITSPVVIDGSTEAGFVAGGSPMVRIDGGNAVGTCMYFEDGTDNSTLKDVMITGCTGDQVSLGQSDNMIIVGNYIGTDGSQDHGGSYGIDIRQSNNVKVGGATAAERNIITGNNNDINLDGNASGAVIQGNYIGVYADGSSSPLSGSQYGVILVTLPQGTTGAPSNTIGGLAAGEGNVIAGHSSAEIWIMSDDQSFSDNNTIQGNTIGINASGTGAVGVTSGDGVIIENSDNTLVEGNLISGKYGGAEVRVLFNASRIKGSGTPAAPDGTIIRSNRFNMLADGSTALEVLPGTADGVILNGATNTTIGGASATDRNLFANEGYEDILLGADGTTGTNIQGNYFGLQADGLSLISGQATNNSAIHVAPASGTASNNTVRGNFIVQAGAGIWLAAGADHNQVAGNYVGVAKDGISAPGAPYGNDGIAVGGASNVIGGLTAADRNVVSNFITGVGVSGASSTGNTIEGNYIGTDASGTVDAGNTLYGIFVGSNAAGTMIGGISPGAGNVISGQGGSLNAGVMVDTGATNTSVLGNFVGTNKYGSAAIPNTDGIRAIDANVMIGDNLTPGNNLIAGNAEGILIQNTAGSTVFGNRLGVSADGSTPLANNFGISIGNTSAQVGNNLIANATVGVSVGAGATSVDPSSGNCFTGNTSYAVDNQSGGPAARFTGNWWGSASGPFNASSNPLGTGDKVTDLVDFSGFLTVPPAACKSQLLVNAGFETDANHDRRPDGWTFIGLKRSDKQDCIVHQAGSCSLKLTGNGSTKTASQTILKTGGAGEPFGFDLWSKASGVPTGGVYRLQVKFFNGSTLLAKFNKKFKIGTHGFQQVSGTYTPPGPYTKIVVTIMFKELSGKAWFDTSDLTWAP